MFGRNLCNRFAPGAFNCLGLVIEMAAVSLFLHREVDTFDRTAHCVRRFHFVL